MKRNETIPVINIRGTNGSGKSYVVKKWLETQKGVPHPRRQNLLGGDTLTRIPTHYVLKDGGMIIGPYIRSCGGTDTMDSLDAVREFILKQLKLKPKYILFEGVIASSVFESWVVFSKTVGGMYWVFLDTPLEICLQRIYERNHNKKIIEKYVKDKYRSVHAIKTKAVEAGERVVMLGWQTAVEDFTRFMETLQLV